MMEILVVIACKVNAKIQVDANTEGGKDTSTWVENVSEQKHLPQIFTTLIYGYTED